MASNALLAALVGAAGVGGYLVYQRAKAAQKTGGACASIFQPLGRMVGFDIPPAACGAIDSLVAKVLEGFDAKDAKNKQLNGAVEIELDELTRGLSVGVGAGNADRGGAGPYLRGSVLRFASGCTPIEGTPGWTKCAPGTASMQTESVEAFTISQPPPKLTGLSPVDMARAVQAAAVAKVSAERHMSSLPGDPTTSYDKLADGSYIIAGQRYVCPAGQVVEPHNTTIVRDSRTGKTTVVARCAAPGASTLPPPPPTVGDSPFGGQTIQTGAPTAPPPGYHWVVDHWERL